MITRKRELSLFLSLVIRVSTKFFIRIFSQMIYCTRTYSEICKFDVAFSVCMMKMDGKQLLVLPRRVRLITTKVDSEQLLVLTNKVIMIKMSKEQRLVHLW
jgi:hypothetical protein